MVSGYSDPGNVDTNDTLDPAWGDDVRANQNLFNGIHTKYYPVYKNNSIASVTNSTTPITVFEYTIPAGDMGTGGIVYSWKAYCAVINNSGGAVNVSFTVTYGATAMGSFNPRPNGIGTARIPMIFDGWIQNQASASQQNGGISMQDTNDFVNRGCVGLTSTENSANALVLKFTIAWSAANSGDTLYKYSAVVFRSE